jgi:DNA-binding response OmpR family regulator
LPIISLAKSVMDKILVVDDDQESRDLLCEVLATHGYAPYAVSDGPTAREILRDDPNYRLVVADVHMPEESGLELLRKLREENSGHEVILMSSFMSHADKSAAKALGAQNILDKPFKIAELLDAVAACPAQNLVVSEACGTAHV